MFVRGSSAMARRVLIQRRRPGPRSQGRRVTRGQLQRFLTPLPVRTISRSAIGRLDRHSVPGRRRYRPQSGCIGVYFRGSQAYMHIRAQLCARPNRGRNWGQIWGQDYVCWLSQLMACRNVADQTRIRLLIRCFHKPAFLLPDLVGCLVELLLPSMCGRQEERVAVPMTKQQGQFDPTGSN